MRKLYYLCIITVTLFFSCINNSATAFNYALFNDGMNLVEKLSIVLYEEYTGNKIDESIKVRSVEKQTEYWVVILDNVKINDSGIQFVWTKNNLSLKLFNLKDPIMNPNRKKIEKVILPEGLLLRNPLEKDSPAR